MGGRKPDLVKHEWLFDTIERYPGLTVWQLAKIMGLSSSAVNSLLPSMENTGYLLTEDGTGRLYTFYYNDVIGRKREWAIRLYTSGFALTDIAELIFGYRGGDTDKRIKDWVNGVPA